MKPSKVPTLFRFILWISLITPLPIQAISQTAIETESRLVVEEGKRLYQSEITSWNGTDIFLGQFKQTDKIGGYFSYPASGGEKCIFFSKGDSPNVIGSVQFDSANNMKQVWPAKKLR